MGQVLARKQTLWHLAKL